MKFFFYIVFLILFFHDTSFAETYYFKNCKISENLSGNYIINIEKKEIDVEFIKSDGSIQIITDKIEVIEINKIVSEKIQSSKGKHYYFQYFLDAESKSITKQEYKKESDFFKLDGPVRKNFCTDVKAGWIRKTEKDEEKNEKRTEIKFEESLSECIGDDRKKWKNCKGKYIAKDGTKYDGRFKNGKIIEGTIIYPGNSKYVGKLKNEKPHGQGKFIFPDGSIYIGDWENGKSHGNGIKTWKDGRKYTGEFKNDEPNGEGTYIYSDESTYRGQFKDGKRHGKGTLTYSNGAAYIGNFFEGTEVGEGICIKQDGSSIECKILKTEGKNKKTEKNTNSILIEGKKWIRISEYESNSGKTVNLVMVQLKNDFTQKALEICSVTKKFNIIEQKIVLLEIDETPAFGLEAKVKIGLDGVVECK